MWNVWYLVIVFFALAIGLSVWAIALEKQSRSYWGADNEFHVIGAVIFAIAAIILFLVALFRPMGAQYEIDKFNYVSEMTAQSIENGSDLENLAITTKVIEMNEWLADVKATRSAYGNWTIYNMGDLGEKIDALKPIGIANEKDGG